MSHRRTFRVFVSSTFSDMKAERNALQAHVFPRLKELCERHGGRFQAIDLRWGVTTEAQMDQQAMNICLSEIERCQQLSPRPNFIVLLGNRYGAVPLPAQIEAEEFEELLGRITSQEDRKFLFFDEENPPDLDSRKFPSGNREGWYRRDDNAIPAQYVLLPRELNDVETIEPVREEERKDWEERERRMRHIILKAIDAAGWAADEPRRFKYNCSSTHEEIVAGLAQKDAEDHVFAYMREIRELPQNMNVAGFVDLKPDGSFDDAGWRQQQALRKALVERLQDNAMVDSVSWPTGEDGAETKYSPVRRMAAFFLHRLSRVIRSQIDSLEMIDPLIAENAAHREFGRERSRHFVGRTDLQSKIDTYLKGSDPHPLIVHGPSGSGKTALMARAFLDFRSDNAILRLIGTTPGSSQIRSLLEDLGRQIHRASGTETGEIPTDINRLNDWFRERLAQATADGPIVLFLDALDQLSEVENSHNLAWLPQDLPEHVRVVVSILERAGEQVGRLLETAQDRFRHSTFLPVQPLERHDARKLLHLWLADEGRTLNEEVQAAAILEPFARNGLPLWLRLAFNEARHWRSFSPAPLLPENPADLIHQMLKRLQRPENHGPLLVDRALGYLAAARHGLSEGELLDVLAADDDYWNDFLAHRHHNLPGGVRRLPVAVWVRLYADLAPYLTEQQANGTILLGFYHRLLRETVNDQFLTVPNRQQRHRQLAFYFFHQNCWIGNRIPNTRKLDECAVHLVASGMWSQLYDCLTDPDFIEASCSMGETKTQAESRYAGVYTLIQNYRVALETIPPGEFELPSHLKG